MRVACILFNRDIELSEFAQACIRFSPQIALRCQNAIFIEIGKCSKLYSEQIFILRVQVLLRRFQYQARIEIANDIPTALALARYSAHSIDHLPIEALCDFGDPFGTDHNGRKWIEKMIDALKRLGIKSIAQFKTLPVKQFPSRFGSLGLFCRQQIENAIHLPWPYWKPPENFTEKMELVHSEFCSDLEPLLFKSKELLDRLFSRLRGKFLRADKIQFSIELEKFSTVKNPLRSWEFEFISPQGSTSGFLPILRERLNRDLQIEPIESFVTTIIVHVAATSIGVNAQKNFFHSREERVEIMGSFFGQMEEFLGKGQVFWAAITEERFPEKSWIKRRLPEEQKLSLLKRYPKRPTRVFKTPIPVVIIQDRFVLKGRRYKIKKWSSVERISLDWLDDVSARNYYRVDLDQGTTVWIFTDPQHNYFLHGYYE